jgi:hypothetical protein
MIDQRDQRDQQISSRYDFDQLFPVGPFVASVASRNSFVPPKIGLEVVFLAWFWAQSFGWKKLLDKIWPTKYTVGRRFYNALLHKESISQFKGVLSQSVIQYSRPVPTTAPCLSMW